MAKVIISVLGQDRPGIIAAVSATLLAQQCNIENVAQTILQSQFSGIFIATTPHALAPQALTSQLNRELAAMGLEAFVRPLLPQPEAAPVPSEPFVITTRGPDRKGLVAGITAVLARHNVNVTQLQAVFKGGLDPGSNIMIYEVDVPMAIDRSVLRDELRRTAAELGLTISIQHRHIFEALNRI
jgi:glycine cleavage system transcriptional repressor